MSVLEFQYVGEPLKIGFDETTTASDVIKIVNARWPGTAKLLSDSIADKALCDALKTINEAVKAERRRQKVIDRIAWKAENKQRFQKGWHFK
jgi:hypothetical protein